MADKSLRGNFSTNNLKILMPYIFALLLFPIALIFLIPFIWMVITAFKPEAEIFSRSFLPSQSTGENFQRLLEIIPFFRCYLNSIVVGVSQVSLGLLFSSLAGYAFAKYDFPLKSAIFIALMATMMIPFYVRLVPLFILMVWFGWVDHYAGLIVPGVVSVFGMFFMRQYIAGNVPLELLDSGRIDGCSEFGLYYRLVLPLIKPAIGAITIFLFMGSWNNFLWPLIIIKSETKFTLPLGLANLSTTYGLEYGPVMAGAFLAVVPVVTIFLIMQKQFVRGITLGALKG